MKEISFKDKIKGKCLKVNLNYIEINTPKKFDKLNNIEVYCKINLKRKFPNTKTYFSKQIIKIKNKNTIRYIKQKLKNINQDYQTFLKLIKKVGCSDLVIIGDIKEELVFIEIKTEEDGLRNSQIKWIQEAQELGFKVYVVYYKVKKNYRKFNIFDKLKTFKIKCPNCEYTTGDFYNNLLNGKKYIFCERCGYILNNQLHNLENKDKLKGVITEK